MDSTKDIDAVMGLFADDGILIDPHFPNPRMEGKMAITEGLRGAMTKMQSFGYTTVNYFQSVDDHRAAVETATHHVARNGKVFNFHQVFVFETVEGRIMRMQAYEPYGPPGLTGLFFFIRLLKRFSRRKYREFKSN